MVLFLSVQQVRENVTITHPEGEATHAHPRNLGNLRSIVMSQPAQGLTEVWGGTLIFKNE
jgi:hypothetical protein